MTDYAALIGATGNSIADVVTELRARRAHAWHGRQSIMVTRFDLEPEGKSIHVWIGAGDMAELLDMQPVVEDFGRANGCVIATIEGRKGWMRALRGRGFVVRGSGDPVTLGKVL